MREYQQKKRFKRIIYSPTGVILLLIIATFLVRGAWEVSTKEIQSKKDVRRVSQELKNAESKEVELTKNIARLNTEVGKEKEIREKFNVRKENEEVVLVVDKPKNMSTSTKEESFWRRLRGVIASIFKSD